MNVYFENIQTILVIVINFNIGTDKYDKTVGVGAGAGVTGVSVGVGEGMGVCEGGAQGMDDGEDLCLHGEAGKALSAGMIGTTRTARDAQLRRAAPPA